MSDEPTASHRLTRRERVLVSVGAFVGGVLAKLLGATWRLRSVTGDEHLGALLEGAGPVVFACWHNRLAVCGHYVERRLVRCGLPIVALVSRSRDGELLARLAGSLGYRVVRGSPTRGGLHGLRSLYRAVRREGACVGTAPDGSQGPVYVAKAGVVILSQISGAPIVPLAGAADRVWRLRSWDRLIVPKPFARLALAVGEPISIAPDLDRDALEEATRALQETLNGLVRRAEAGLGGA